jgi:hypothetical protein
MNTVYWYCIILIFNVHIQIQIRIQQKPVSGSASLHCIVHDGVRRLVDHHLGLGGEKGDNRTRFWVGSEAEKDANRHHGKSPQIIIIF